MRLNRQSQHQVVANFLTHAAQITGEPLTFTPADTGGGLVAYVARLDVEHILVFTDDVAGDLTFALTISAAIYDKHGFEDGGHERTIIRGRNLHDVLAGAVNWSRYGATD